MRRRRPTSRTCSSEPRSTRPSPARCRPRKRPARCTLARRDPCRWGECPSGPMRHARHRQFHMWPTSATPSGRSNRRERRLPASRVAGLAVTCVPSASRPLKNGTGSELASRFSGTRACREVPVPISQHAPTQHAPKSPRNACSKHFLRSRRSLARSVAAVESPPEGVE